jgi:hypothetical protein
MVLLELRDITGARRGAGFAGQFRHGGQGEIVTGRSPVTLCGESHKVSVNRLGQSGHRRRDVDTLSGQLRQLCGDAGSVLGLGPAHRPHGGQLCASELGQH